MNAATIPEGAAQYMSLRELAAILHRAAVLAALIGVMFLLQRAQLPTEPWVSWVMLAIALATIVLASMLFTRVTTVGLDRLGRRREARIGAARQSWARRRGWGYRAAATAVDAAEAALILPPKTTAVQACRTLEGRVQGHPARMETWILARPRRRLSYRRGDRRLGFLPVLATFIVIEPRHRLPRAGFFSYFFAQVPAGPPQFLAAQKSRSCRSVAKNIITPDIPVEDLMPGIQAQLQQARRPPVRIVAADHRIAMMSFDEPAAEELEERLYLLSSIAEGLRPPARRVAG